MTMICTVPVNYWVGKARIRIHLIRIWIQHFRLNTDPDPIWIQGFDDQKWKKNLQVKKYLIFIGSKTTISYPLAYRKDVQATEGTFSPQK
jgi:hypothetical protein